MRELGGAKTLCNRDGTFAWGDGRQSVREGTFAKGDGGQNVREGMFAKGDLQGHRNNSTPTRIHGCIPAVSVDEGKRECQVGVSRE